MTTTPTIYGPDGIARETTKFSTTLPTRFFEGTIDANTVDMQIRIRGSAWTSDPDLLVFEGTSFSFPNPAVYSDGLEFIPGLNVIEVRSISFSGATSASAVVEVTLIQESDADSVGSPPTSIYIEQESDAVTIFAQGVDDENFIGINIYASRFPGGGSTGYSRINLEIISDGDQTDVETTLLDQSVDVTLQTASNGALAADPMYIHLTQGEYSTQNAVENPEEIDPQTDEEGAAAFQEIIEGLIRTDVVTAVEVPETSRRIRTSWKVSTVSNVTTYSFTHHRNFGPANEPPTIAIGEFASTSKDEPLYYVVTAMFYNPTSGLEYESPYSTEVAGKPVTILQTIGTFPAPSRLQVVQSIIAAINRTEPELAIQPGSVIRDTVVDPISDEIIQLRGLVDFMYRCQSFDTLLQIDGVESDGTSTPVERSAYKQALQRIFNLTNANDVQIIVDTAFEQLASRNGEFRDNGARARVVVTFYSSKRPTATVTFPIGTRIASGTISYVTTAFAEIPLASLASYFNPSTGLYSVDVSAQAEQEGSSGNVGVGQIRSILSNVPGFSVINQSRAFGGRDRQTNLQLAVAGRSALASVDTGTEQGLLQAAAKMAGVEGALIAAAGDPLMQRDMLDGKHIGGKVDVWVRGESLGQVTDTFAFAYEVAENIQFEVFGNPLNLQFRARDANLSEEHPIALMLDREDLGLGFRNATSGLYFDLTNYTLLDYRTIQLSTDVSQPPVTLGDVLLGDYEYRTVMDHIFTRQPVSSVSSVVGEVSGSVDFTLIHSSDPLQEGRSIDAADTLRLNPSVVTDNLIDVENETHILFSDYDEFLDNLGANPLSIKVYDETKTVEYRGPNDPSGISDFVIVGGTSTKAAAVRRTQTSEIRSGQQVLIDYSHRENYTVTYTTNFVIQTVQNAIDSIKHATADVLVKSVIPVPVDLTATVVLTSGSQVSGTDRRLRTNVAAFLQALPQGGQVRESDMIRLLDGTTGVSYIQLPLTKLARSEGSTVIRETVTLESTADAVLLMGTSQVPLSSSTVRVWLLVEPLSSTTTTGGGTDANFHAVYQDDIVMDLHATDMTALKNAAGKAFIIGNEGMVIPGYSDDASIESKFPNANTPVEIEEARRSITQNRIMVSTSIDDQPINHTYTTTYIVSEDNNRVQSIELGSLEYFTTGELTFNYVEDERGG